MTKNTWTDLVIMYGIFKSILIYIMHLCKQLSTYLVSLSKSWNVLVDFASISFPSLTKNKGS